MFRIIPFFLILITANLFAQFTGSGTGSYEDPYQVATADQLNEIRNYPGDYFIQTANIDLSGYPNWVPIGDELLNFYGYYDGNGFTISNLSIAAGTLIYPYNVGLFGYINRGTITKVGLINPSVEMGYLEYVGCLVGYLNSGTVTQCYVIDGRISGSNYIGGLVGYVGEGCAISNCYTRCSVAGGSSIGGLAGTSSGGLIEYCYSTSTIIASFDYGCVVGSNYGAVSNCLWDTEFSGIYDDYIDGTYGHSSDDMKRSATFTDLYYWDFFGENTHGTNDYWKISSSENDGYPFLSCERGHSPFSSGDGTSGSPYQVAAADQLNSVRNYLGSYFIQTANIDLSSYDNWEPIGSNSSPFTGNYNGDGFTISNLTISRSGTDEVGLFGYIGSSAFIQKVGLINSSVTGAENTGGLTGYLSGEISLCYISGGTITGSNQTGGLAGYLAGGSTISNSYARCSVTGSNSNTGGFAGNSAGTIINCYSSGSVAATGGGGFIGLNTGTITNCFWDMQTSGKSTSAGGTGKTTDEMKTLATFRDSPSNWDFELEDINGTNNCWDLDLARVDNNGYPFLSYQNGTDIKLNLFAGGSGTSSNPYLIETADQLNLIRYYLSSYSYFRQIANIDLSSYTNWEPLGNATTNFNGEYNGNAFTISNLTINRSGTQYVGLFGYMYGNVIKNLGLINPNVTGGTRTGSLVGYIHTGRIEQCYVTGGSVTGGSVVGGLIGDSYQTPVNYCYARCSVTGTNVVGGITGSNGSTGVFTSCYSAGSVTASSNGGGFAGTGSSDKFVNCFWDNNVESIWNNGLGTGKSSADMKTKATFLDWDPDIWNIGDGINEGYPYLKWQNPGGSPLPVELTSFTANAEEGKVILNWTTATEVNNYGFNVERRAAPLNLPQGETLETPLPLGKEQEDGLWEAIAFVAGSGSSNSPKQYSFIDEKPVSGNLMYRLKQIDLDGSFEYYSTLAEVNFSITSIEEKRLPIEFGLSQNFPNPFNPSTVIKYEIPQSSYVTLEVYTVLGEKIATLVNKNISAGYHEVIFNGNNLNSGIYIYRLTAASPGDGRQFTTSAKMMLIK